MVCGGEHCKGPVATHVRDLAELGIGVAGGLLGCLCLQEGLLLERFDVLAGVGYSSLGGDEGSAGGGLWERTQAQKESRPAPTPGRVALTSAFSALLTLSRLSAGVCRSGVSCGQAGKGRLVEGGRTPAGGHCGSRPGAGSGCGSSGS